jgi:tetratricopeptide (TPR) repeat protein
MKANFVAMYVLISVATILIIPATSPANGDIPQHFQRSFYYEDKGDLATALNEVLKILQTDASNYTAVLRSAWLYYRRGYYDDSIVQYRKAVSLRPEAVEPRLGLTLPLMAAGRWKVAEAAAREVLTSAPSNYAANSRLAYCLYNLGRYGEAATQYLKVLKLYPSDTEMQLGLAWTYVRMGRHDSAKEWFAEVLGVKPSNASALAGSELAVTHIKPAWAYR